MSHHTIIIVGNVGKDPELRYTPNGSAITSFSVATNRKYTSSAGQPVDETAWFRVSVFGKQAETTNQYLKKGSLVYVEGRLRSDKNGGPRIWTRQDGTPGASFEVTANTVRFLSTKGEGGAAAPEGGEPVEGEEGGDIPF